MKLYQPEKLYIEKAALDYPLTKRICARLAPLQPQIVEDVHTLLQDVRAKSDPIGEGKRSLLLAYDRGRSFKPFPESDPYLSCDYYTLHVAEGCDLECSYCILQAYLTNPLLTVFVNVEEMLAQLQDILNQNIHRFFRIGTGQLADSLSLDHLTGFSEILVPWFAKQSNAVLELKTKSVNIGRLLGLQPNGRTIVSWSVNSEKIQKEEEHKCATIDERLDAAQRIASLDGYRVGLHLDPLLDYAGWENDYERLIAQIFNTVPSDRIAWMSLGCLRMMPALKPIMQERFPKSKLTTAEWIRGMDGKLRYFKPRRIEMYQTITAMIRSHCSRVPLYLTMETPEVWRQVFGWEPTKSMVCELLDQAGAAAAPRT